MICANLNRTSDLITVPTCFPRPRNATATLFCASSLVACGADSTAVRQSSQAVHPGSTVHAYRSSKFDAPRSIKASKARYVFYPLADGTRGGATVVYNSIGGLRCTVAVENIGPALYDNGTARRPSSKKI